MVNLEPIVWRPANPNAGHSRFRGRWVLRWVVYVRGFLKVRTCALKRAVARVRCIVFLWCRPR
jgi:hypothetical protein